MEVSEPLRGLLIYLMAATIPVVALGLWLQYFDAYLEEARKKGSDLEPLDETAETAPFNAAIELKRVRAAGLFTLLSQIVIYIASSPLREHYWWAAAVYFSGAILLQNHFQARREAILRTENPSGKDSFNSTLRLILWNVAGIAAYLFLVQLSALCFALLAQALKLPQGAGLTLTLAGGMIGILAGLVLTFGLAPYQIRGSMKSTLVQDPELLDVLHQCFERAGVTCPAFYIVETPHSSWHNAWVAGFSRGKGIFQPGLFLTRPLLSHFNLQEIEAIVLHEVSHLALHHLRKRLLYTVALLFGSTAILSVVGVLAFALLPPGTQPFPILVTAIASLLLPMRLVRNQVAHQEFEADETAIRRFGASAHTYATVLRKLSTLNQPPGSPHSTQPNPSGHPTLEARLMRVEMLRAMEDESVPPENKDHEKKAA